MDVFFTEFRTMTSDLCKETAVKENKLTKKIGPLFDAAFEAFSKGNVEEAISLYREYISHVPNFADAHYNLAIALKASGDYENALHEYEVATTLSPNDQPTHSNLGVLLAEMGQFERAISEFKKALDLDPNDACTRTNLASAYEDMGDDDSAISSYRSAIVSDPQYRNAYWNLGKVLLKLQRPMEALPVFQELSRLAPDDSEVTEILSNLVARTSSEST